MRPRTHLSRALAALVLALFALGWLGDRAHTTLERHAWCDEHQRVEHQDVEHGSLECQAGPPSHCESSSAHCSHDEDAPAGPALEAPRPRGSEHEACGLLLARGGDPVGVAPARASTLDPLTDLGRAHGTPGADAAHASVPLVLLAPKQSPPAA
ncbi:MAG: hypothetical protein JNK02_17565 [Planctomycetes bacterium]|nr:hypothetical protein [Planctomycetota bacterium]